MLYIGHVFKTFKYLMRWDKDQKEKYLKPCIEGKKWDCLAMTEPNAGSDLRGMTASARETTSGDWVLNGTKHFILYCFYGFRN